MRFRYAFGYSTQARMLRIGADNTSMKKDQRKSAQSASSAFYFIGRKIYA
jgi:hypothetical protein